MRNNHNIRLSFFNESIKYDNSVILYSILYTFFSNDYNITYWPLQFRIASSYNI